MDRLLCGDVGFGKTEVALRAVMKAVLDSKQVAILVPTTVLAQQHYQTVVSRFRGFPVNVDVLSRFRTPAQQKKTLQDLRAGTLDVVIGTHTSFCRKACSLKIWAFWWWMRSSASASLTRSG
ncbi:MAG: DEAD/DEAH box helicase [Oscillospiraceae bacterium]